ncbi:GrpB family protein [Actinoplanes subglobosus]|uniref:GrpB family protein n=1 Tax=Actinoplanes subglobosus TaxID=1547892 RepID=A0ABV8IRI6_9ACTN
MVVNGTPIEVVDYDPAWPGMAAEAIAELWTVLHGVVSAIEHIGSTAVPGLAAKPTIDLMAAAADLAEVEGREGSLADHGYRRHSNAMTDRLLYVRFAGRRRTHILHMVAADTWPTRNQRILRDYLRAHPAEAERYARLKRDVADAGTHPADYARAKTALIQELTDRARAARGLPSVPVWEK